MNEVLLDNFIGIAVDAMVGMLILTRRQAMRWVAWALEKARKPPTPPVQADRPDPRIDCWKDTGRPAAFR